MEQTLKVCIYGATGYTALELVRILSQHPYVRITNLVSSSKAGKYVADVMPHLSPVLSGVRFVSEPQEEYDLAFLCLPHDVSMELVPELLNAGKKVIDLSGAYRIKDKSMYPEFYGFEHRYPDLLKESVYGLPEIFREKLKSASLVANPGCYPTATLLALYPLMKKNFPIEEVIVHALSGVSGAGRSLRQSFHFPEMEENFFAYSVHKHRHIPEMEGVAEELMSRRLCVRFTPVVVPSSRGMLSTVYVRMDKIEPMELFLSVYRDEPFVHVVDTPPSVKWALGTNNCFLYPFYDDRTGLLVVLSAIDNLGKGASLQAVQNMNLMSGIDERTAIPSVSLYP